MKFIIGNKQQKNIFAKENTLFLDEKKDDTNSSPNKENSQEEKKDLNKQQYTPPTPPQTPHKKVITPKKKLSWGKVIVISLIILLIVMLFWGIFAGGNWKNVSESEFISLWNNWTSNGSNFSLLYNPLDEKEDSQFYLVIYDGYVELVFNCWLDGSYQGDYVLYFETKTEAVAFIEALPGVSSTYPGGNLPLWLSPVEYQYSLSGWEIFVTQWLPWIIFIGIIFWLMSSAVKKQQGVGKLSKKLIPQFSNVRFADIAGYDEVKKEMVEVVDFLRQPVKYQIAGARTPKGVLLTGAPGTGKTLWAKAVAGEAGVPFFSLSGSDFVEMYVGVGASRVRSLFESAKASGASIVFIDEIDAVGRQRGAGVGGGNDEREQTLNQLLVELDGFTQNTGVIVLAATNRPDVLDPALKRPGRFDREITIRLPDVFEREAILRNYSRKGNKVFAKNINFTAIAYRTPGFSGAELENVINEATILSIRLQTGVITVEVIDEAIDRVMGGPSKSLNTITYEEKIHIAYHESGHAIIGLVKDHAQKVQKISIIPRGQAGGYVLMTPKKEKNILSKNELVAKIISFLGGRASEEVFFGPSNVSTGASSDIHEATDIARRMVTEWGMSRLGLVQYEERQGSVFLGKEVGHEKSFSEFTGKEIDLEIRRIIDLSYQEAVRIVKKYKDDIKLFAAALLLKETLTSEEIEYIFKNKSYPESISIFQKKASSVQNPKPSNTQKSSTTQTKSNQQPENSSKTNTIKKEQPENKSPAKETKK